MIKYGKESMRFIPNHLYLELTDECNLSCRHCYINAGKHGKSRIPIGSAVRVLNEFSTIGESVTLSGGEPLLYEHWPALIEAAARKNLQVMVVTNAVLLTEEAIRSCMDARAAIAISIDGWRRETHDRLRGRGSFDIVRRRLDALMEMNYQDRVILCFVPTRENYLEFPSLVSSMITDDFRNFYISPLENRGRGLRNTSALSMGIPEKVSFLSMLANLLIRYDGTAHIDTGHLKFFFRRLFNNYQEDFDPIEGTLRIAPNGNIYLTAYVDNEKFLLGNIERDSLHSVCAGIRMEGLLDELVRRLLSGPSECRSCEHSFRCGGGSPARSLAKNNSLQSTDEFCEAKKVFFEKWYSACNG